MMNGGDDNTGQVENQGNVPQEGGNNNGGGMSEQDMIMARMQNQGLGGMPGMNMGGMPGMGMGGMGGMSGMGGMGGMGMNMMNHPMMGMMPGMGGMGMPFPPQGEMGGGEMMNPQGGFGSEFDYNMFHMIRKRNMMGNPLLQQQFKNGMGRPEDYQVSSVMIDKLKRGVDGDDDDHKHKKRKKAKKPNDMPRRALSAYNIFFSEQRELILDKIAADEKKAKLKEEGKTDEEIEKILEEDKEAKAAERKKAAEEADKKVKDDDDNKEGKKEEEEEGDDVPKVMNRTFFPTRAKRAHRKVHGKIGLVNLAREVSTRWKALSDDKRKVYQDLAEKDRERHKKVMADYQERKAAENMISMGSPGHEAQEAPAAPAEKLNLNASSDQDVRDSVAQQHQQRILFEMMRQQQQQQMMMMGGGVPGMMGMGAPPAAGPGGSGGQDPNQWRQQMGGMAPM